MVVFYDIQRQHLRTFTHQMDTFQTANWSKVFIIIQLRSVFLASRNKCINQSWCLNRGRISVCQSKEDKSPIRTKTSVGRESVLDKWTKSRQSCHSKRDVRLSGWHSDDGLIRTSSLNPCLMIMFSLPDALFMPTLRLAPFLKQATQSLLHYRNKRLRVFTETVFCNRAPMIHLDTHERSRWLLILRRRPPEDNLRLFKIVLIPSHKGLLMVFWRLLVTPGAFTHTLCVCVLITLLQLPEAKLKGFISFIITASKREQKKKKVLMNEAI